MKEKREVKGLTRAQLGHLCGISEQFVYYIETGGRRPSPKIAKKIAIILEFEWTKFYDDSGICESDKTNDQIN